MKKVIIRLIRLYQVVFSPDTGRLSFLYQLSILNPAGLAKIGCRNTPTCSEYAIKTISQEGVWKGFYKTLIRIAHCY